MNPELAAAIYDELLPGWRNARLVSGNRRIRCPFHDDHKPSFDIHEEKLVWMCRVCGAGGGAWDLAVRTLGEDAAHELVERLSAEVGGESTNSGGRGEGRVGLPPKQRSTRQHSRGSGVTLAQYAAAKRLPEEFLAELGVREVRYFGPPSLEIPYRDCEGQAGPVRYRIRLEKGPEGDERFRWKKGGPKALPYGLWRLDRFLPAGYLILVEGESDAQTLWRHRFPALGIPGAASWRDEWAAFLDGFPVVYAVVEPDKGGETFRAKLAASSLRDRLRLVSLAPHKDASDLHVASPEGFRKAFDAALLSAVPASAIAIVPPELAPLLDRVVSVLRRYVVFQKAEHAVAIALWVAHTFIFEQFDSTPYLAITSAEKRSGKTRLLDVLEAIVARAWRSVMPSEAVVYRKISQDKPTLMLDEVDAIYGPKAREHEGLRALLNAGYRRGTTVPRCVGKSADLELRDFEVYCPKALAGIGTLPDTIADRAIPIRLERRSRGEQVARFRQRDGTEECAPIMADLAAWAGSVDFSLAHPEIPEELGDRAADFWEPLLAIADAAGAAWPEQARSAARKLHAEQEESEASVGVRLLADIWGVFNAQDEDTIFTEDLLEALNGLEDASWGDFRGRQLTAQGLSRLLKPYAIKPSTVRIGEETKKGYTRAQFQLAWDRYAPSSSSQSCSYPSQRHSPEDSRGCDVDVAGCDGVTDGRPSGEDEEGQDSQLERGEL
ncbi:MAG TPA: DUF3631 domain-containing protein [Myxococcota bacterium]|nr:DUF3631 domain-containing protein [Myxococcota bacterium]